MKITFHGHACVEIVTDDGYTLLIDPFIKGNPKSDLTLDKKVDYILVTHGHKPHVGDMLELSKRNHAPIIAITELAKYAKKNGAESFAMNLGADHTFDFGYVKLMHSQHSSSIEIDGEDRYAGEACGFMIEANGKTVFHTGDTSNFGDMAIFGKTFNIDVACLPIGGLYTMNPLSAALCAQRLNAKHVIPIHYNTYPEIAQDPNEFAKLLPDNVVQILDSGQTFEI